MDATRILSADILDILFERMNKEYGAYQLRKGYNQRLKKALSVTGAVALLAIAGMEVSQWYAKYQLLHRPIVKDVSLINVVDHAPAPVIPPVIPKTVTPPRIETIRFTALKIVDQPAPDKNLKNMDDLKDVTIGKFDQTGIKDPSIVNPAKVDHEEKVVGSPAPDNDNVVFTKVEMEAEFPGGPAKWSDYVRQVITSHIDELQDDGKSGTVEVQFIVDKTGQVSNVEALSLQGTKLAEIAVNAIRHGPKWKPAQQNGRFVNAFRRQKITFQMPTDN